MLKKNSKLQILFDTSKIDFTNIILCKFVTFKAIFFIIY